MDISRFIEGPLYSLLLAIMRLLWNINRFFINATMQLDGFNGWLLDGGQDVIDIVTEAAQGAVGMSALLAVSIYGFWLTLSSIMPNMGWKPVELPKAINYIILGSLFLAAPAATLVTVDGIRTGLATAIQAEILTDLSVEIAPEGYTSSDEPISLSPITTSSGALGPRIVASIVGAVSIEEFGSSNPPQAFLDKFAPLDQFEFENLNPDDRTDAMGQLYEGIAVMLYAPVINAYAFAEVALWTLLNVVVLILWIGLPIALIFAPWTAGEGIFRTFVNKYIGTFIETIVSVILVGIMNTLLVWCLPYGFGLTMGAIFLSFFVVSWRIFSALKLTAAAIDTVGGANVTGGATLSQGAQSVAGAARTIGSLGAAGAGLALAGGAKVGMGLTMRQAKRDGEPVDEDRMSQYRQQSAMGGYLIGQNKTASNVMGVAQTARLVGGFHNPARDGGMDMLDAAYMGSRFAGGGTQATFMTNAMVGGPTAAFDAMGYQMFNSRKGLGYDSAGVDEDGNELQGRRHGYDGGPRGPGGGGGGAPRNRGGSGGNRPRNTPNNGGAGGKQTRPADGDANRDPQPSQPKNGQGSEQLEDRGETGSNQESANSNTTAGTVEFSAGQTGALEQWIDSVPDTDRQRAAEQAQKAHPNGSKVVGMINQHGSGSVKTATSAIQSATKSMREAGLSNEEIAAQFQNGGAKSAIKAIVPDAESNPIVQDGQQLNDLAEFVLRPTSTVEGGQVVSVLAGAVDQGVDPKAVDGELQSQLNTNASFGPFTGAARGIVRRAQNIGATGDQVSTAFQHYQSGNTNQALQVLHQAPKATSEEVGKIMSKFEMIPDTVTVPHSFSQVTAKAPPPSVKSVSSSPPSSSVTPHQSISVEVPTEPDYFDEMPEPVDDSGLEEEEGRK